MLFPSWWGVWYRRANTDFEDIDISEVLMVVDMQFPFFWGLIWEEAWIENGAEIHEKLCNNIASRVEETLNTEWAIILVEHWGKWKTIKRIRKITDQVPERVVTLSKRKDSLLCPENTELQLDTNRRVIDSIKERWVKITGCGVNTPFCVKNSVMHVRDRWVQASIALWSTLQATQSTSFEFRNQTQRIQDQCWRYPDLLDFGNKPNTLPYLWDYL